MSEGIEIHKLVSVSPQVSISDMTRATTKPPQRLFSLDFLKAISIVSVVSYHSIFLPRDVYSDQAMALDVLFSPLRFFVPILLTISFLLMERGFDRQMDFPKGMLIKKRLIRLAIPTGFWFVLAAGLKVLTGNPISEVSMAILTGTIFHGAYFLLVLFQCLPLFVWFRTYFKDRRIIFLTLLIQGIFFISLTQLILIPDADPIVSLLQSINRPLVFYWLAYLGLGVYFWSHWNYLLKISQITPKFFKIGIITICCLGFYYESYHLYMSTQGSVPPFEYAMLTCLFSVPTLFICCLNIEEKHLLPRITQIVKLLSTYSLGIFCVNGILSQILLSILTRFSPQFTLELLPMLIVKCVGWVGLLAISLAISIRMDRLKMGMFVR